MTTIFRRLSHATVLSLTAILTASVQAENPPTIQWGRQLGPIDSPFNKIAASVAGEKIFIGGSTRGNLGGPALGERDAWLARFDDTGNTSWVRQIGTSMDEAGRGIAAGAAGGVLLTGITYGALHTPNSGESDMFLAKYNDAGELLWTRMLGSQASDSSSDVAVDGSGNAFIAGSTLGDLGSPRIGSNDVVVAKYDATGAHVWTRQFGTANGDLARSVAADGQDNVVTTGYWNLTASARSDSFVAKHDPAGNELWLRQFGTSGVGDEAQGIAIDSQDNVFVTGFTGGSLGGPLAGAFDAFLLKYDAGGNLLWTRQFGSDSEEVGYDVAVDNQGNAYVVGQTSGDLGGNNAGLNDVFLTKYGPTGNLLWSYQFGTSATDFGTDVSVLPSGQILLTGTTQGGLFGDTPVSSTDAWVALFSQVPEPSGLALIGIAILFLVVPQRRVDRLLDG